MKSLYIMRHAKSSWEYPDLCDEERPLLEKGVKRTHKIIHFLKSKNVTLDLIISSHAVRALETAKMIAGAMNYPEDRIDIRKRVYHGDTDELLKELFSLDDSIESVLIVGHNPGFTRFANYFLNDQIEWLPTSGVVRIDFRAASWNDIVDAAAEKIFLVYPKLLK